MPSSRRRLAARGLTLATAAACALMSTPRPAWSWATAEHVRFGMQIADPFEHVMGHRLPVLTAWPDPTRPGPQTFGHYVSAPDFARGLLYLLDREPIVGPVPCAALWNPEGVVDGGDFHDHIHDMVVDDGPAPVDNVGYTDCVDSWRANNSHFGEFAARHYAYYHELAVEAARRFRSNRDPACRAAAYTLEGWGQHYLTDATAIGHAWTPSGTYDGTTYDWQTLHSPERMRIHDYLNEHGGRYAGDAYELGIVWGDHSERHSGDGLSVPEREGDAQRALSLRIARIGLGQVVSVAECGGRADAADVFVPRVDAGDPRRVDASDRSMCELMYGHQIVRWAPDYWNLFGIDLPQVRAAVLACKASRGKLTTNPDGAALARHYFQDAYYHAGAADGFINPAIDGRAELFLEDLGCHDDGVVEPLDSPEQRDVCGHLLCETPPRTDGTCPAPLRLAAGCCHPDPTLVDGDGAIEATPWSAAPATDVVALPGAGAVIGDSAEFLWLPERVAPFAVRDFTPLHATPVTLDSDAGGVSRCADDAVFSVYEARVRLPRTRALAGATVYLSIHELDEGVEITVDDRLVRYVRRDDAVDPSSGAPRVLTVPLVNHAAPPADGDAYRVRLAHLNDCDHARPLRVTLHSDGDGGDKADRIPTAEDAAVGGCAMTGASSGGPVALAAFLLVAWSRRRRGRAR